MFKLAKPFFMITETPVHAGSGSDLGIVDMPIQRERHTGYPKIESSSLKGSIREAFANNKDIIKVNSLSIDGKNLGEAIDLVFGPEDLSKNAYAAALGFTDARVLLFPVKSMKGVFAWVTCPEVLNRLVKDLHYCGCKDVPEQPEENTVPYSSGLVIKNNSIVLEEYSIKVQPDNDPNGKCSRFAHWLADNIWPNGKLFEYWKDKSNRNFVVLSDNEFCDFVNLSTEVVTRTKIDTETGTVKEGHLFTEEYLPSDTVLYSLALATSIKGNRNDEGTAFKEWEGKHEVLVMKFFEAGLPPVIQTGGNATIGKGFIRLKVMEV
jgi:CRISPR-associated protein Cmr4